MQFFIAISFAVLFLGKLASASPVPEYKSGEIVAVNPKKFDQPDPTTLSIKHQAVVLNGPDDSEEKKYQVALVSSTLAADRYPHQEPKAEQYHPQFTQGHSINLGTPDKIAEKYMFPSNKIPGGTLAADTLKGLKDKINANCNAGLTRRDGSCKFIPRKKAGNSIRAQKALVHKAPRQNVHKHQAQRKNGHLNRARAQKGKKNNGRLNRQKVKKHNGRL